MCVVVDPLDQHHVVSAVVRALPLVGDLAGPIRWERIAVQPGQVADVDDVLDVVEPVRVHRLHLHRLDAALHEQHVVQWQQRRRLGAQVAEHQAAELLRLVRLQPNPLLERAALWLGGLLHTLPRAIVEPAMIRATQARALDAAVVQRHAPMRTAQLHQAGLPVLHTIEHQFFAQQFQALGLLR